MNFNRFFELFDSVGFSILRSIVIPLVLPIFFLANCCEDEDDYVEERRSRRSRKSRSRSRSRRSSGSSKSNKKRSKDKKKDLRKQAKMDTARCQYKPPSDKKAMVDKGEKEYKTLYGLSNEKVFGTPLKK